MSLAQTEKDALVEGAENLVEDVKKIAAAIHAKKFEDAMVLASETFGKAHSHAVNLKHQLQAMP